MAPGAGPVTARTGVTTPKAPLAPLAVVGPVAVRRTRAAAVSGPVTVQVKLPVLGAAAASVSNEPPPSRLSSTSTVALGGRLSVQAMASDVPTKATPADGAVTVSVGVATSMTESATAELFALSRALTRM